MGLERQEEAVLDLVAGQGFSDEMTAEQRLNEGRRSKP